jgi:hypothetical protein
MRATFLGRMCFAEAARRDRREAPVNLRELVKETEESLARSGFCGLAPRRDPCALDTLDPPDIV